MQCIGWVLKATTRPRDDASGNLFAKKTSLLRFGVGVSWRWVSGGGVNSRWVYGGVSYSRVSQCGVSSSRVSKCGVSWSGESLSGWVRVRWVRVGWVRAGWVLVEWIIRLEWIRVDIELQWSELEYTNSAEERYCRDNSSWRFEQDRVWVFQITIVQIRIEKEISPFCELDFRVGAECNSLVLRLICKGGVNILSASDVKQL